LIELRLPF